MKNSIPKSFFLLFYFGLFFLFSCSAQLLDIKNQTYKSYNRNSERGYVVSFELNDTAVVPKSIVINGIVQDISKANKTGHTYEVNVIAQTTIIHNYEVKLDKRENGIYFEKNSNIFFQPVKFKLITD
ncbi:hypothetical protein [Flavobacterium quisquiliarum]|uniref:Lipoprotein n=1 Tax=Flavobacterium quisquiliarum TaxID=1834436 RepID=A0ABV8VZI9_9FLAO|nr:hypothetical protein [Flavobacterium quisquiliarum]MBW1654535.1 hypothetical protein [Flavobacterium quisquiliarum]NWL01780.1 hypothetical protein [Flavobacterium collinsii]